MSEAAAAAGIMRAAILAGPGQVRMDEVARPEPGPGQVRVRLEGCGVCASNLTPWAGPEWMRFPTEPGALGHEGWGVVDAARRRGRGAVDGRPGRGALLQRLRRVRSGRTRAPWSGCRQLSPGSRSRASRSAAP